MMKKAIATVCFLLCSFGAQAERLSDSLTIYAGKDRQGTNNFRLGGQHPIDDWLKRKGIPFGGYLESSINVWDAEKTVYGLAVSPVFSTPLLHRGKYKLNLNAGIGIAVISEKKINDRDVSSLFQFEDRLGLQLKVNKATIYALYLHYSNAGLAKPNDGIDIFTIGVNYRL